MTDILASIGDTNTAPKERPLSEKIVEILRRIKKGWLACFLIIATCILGAWLLYFPLSKIHSATTKMGVMFNKEKEANSQGNIANEIVGRITGWTTTTNKYDEMNIMTSHIVVGSLLKNTGRLDSAYQEYAKEAKHPLSYNDSVQFANTFIEGFSKKFEIVYAETNKIKTSLIIVSMSGRLEECTPYLIGLVNSYNQYTRAYNYQLYDNTLKFLDQCIDNLKKELDALDHQERIFREENLIVDMGQQTGEYLNIDRKMEDELRNINLQIQLLDIIRSYMVDMGKNYKVVPANTGIDDEQINRIVIQFNDLVMRRSNFLTSMGEDAMRVQTITNQIEDQRQALIISIDKLTQSFNIRKKKFENDLEESSIRLEKMPHKRITLDQIQRERSIKTPLYKLLQEKYTETLIAKSAEQDQARIITYPYTEESKMFENPKKLYILGLVLGLILSTIYLWFIKLPPRELTLEEALKKCDLPCWGMLPKIKEKELYEKAMEALLARVRMSDSKIIAITSSYGFEENNLLADQFTKILKQLGEKCKLVKWMPDSQQNLIQLIEQHDRSAGYLILDCCSYHSNPGMPLISSKVDIVLWNIVLEISTLKSIDFINYALKEGLVKKGALVLSDARIDKNNQVNFGNFDNIPSRKYPKIIRRIKLVGLLINKKYLVMKRKTGFSPKNKR